MAKTRTTVSLDIPFGEETELDPEVKEEILWRLWGLKDEHESRSPAGENAKAFWQHYQRCCRYLARDTVFRTHENLLETVERIRGTSTRGAIREQLRTSNAELLEGLHKFEQRLMLTESLDSAARMLTLMEIGNWTYPNVDQQPIRWGEEQTLAEVVEMQLSAWSSASEHDILLPPDFSAMNLERVAGLQIKWTWNLNDHLRLAEQNTVVYFFHGLSCLHWQLDATPCNRDYKMPAMSLIKAEILIEARHTLALLIGDKEVKKWYKKEAKSYRLDTTVLEYGELPNNERKTSTFNYFRGRIIALKHIYDHTKPTTIRQLIYDRRDLARDLALLCGVVVIMMLLGSALSLTVFAYKQAMLAQQHGRLLQQIVELLD